MAASLGTGGFKKSPDMTSYAAAAAAASLNSLSEGKNTQLSPQFDRSTTF